MFNNSTSNSSLTLTLEVTHGESHLPQVLQPPTPAPTPAPTPEQRVVSGDPDTDSAESEVDKKDEEVAEIWRKLDGKLRENASLKECFSDLQGRGLALYARQFLWSCQLKSLA